MNLYTEKMLEESMSFLIETVGFEIEETVDLIKEYIDSLEQELNSIENAIKEKNFLLIKSIAHSLKGSAANCNMNKIAELALALEQTAKLENIGGCNTYVYNLNEYVDELKILSLKII